MADGELTMFGKAYDTVGSTNKNLVLLTRGDLKIRWGNKYIDLIKNGKINVDVELIQKVSDVSEIVKDGIYLIEKEEGNEIWLSVGGTTINIFGEISDNYVAFVKEQDIDVDNKFRALSNIGFYYESMEKAKEKQIKKGLVFILDLNKLYYVEEGEFKEYTLTQTTEIPSPLKLKNITINGEDEYITGTTGLYFSIVNDVYMLLLNDAITFQKLLVTNNTISSEDFQSGQSGFAIYNDDEDYIGEFDVIRVRKSIIYDEVLDVTYEQLRELMEGHKLYPGKQYRITDFFNEWDCYKYDLTSEQSALTTKVYEFPAGVQFYFPVIVTAASKNTLEKEGYYCENTHWVIEYDPSFDHFLCEIEGTVDGEARSVPVYARGRITKLTDEYGNSANYDFKHRLFKGTLSSDDRKTWLYTYNKVRNTTTTNPEKALSWEYIHNNWDASADGNITNNVINLPEPELESYTLNGSTVLKVKLSEDYFIFDCTTNQPYGNNIKHSKGKFNVTGPFYNNTFELLISTDAMTFSLDFHDNVFQGVKDCVLNAPMQFNTFDRNLVNVAFRCDTMKNNHITGVIYTNNSRSTYPIEATNFNNNVINDINMSAITCYGCDIINNNIHDIKGCLINNSTLQDITAKDIIGDNNYSNSPTDVINNLGGTSGGDTPINPGGDTPVNPGGEDIPSGSDIPVYGANVLEPSYTSIDSAMHGTHSSLTVSALSANAYNSEIIGTIDAQSDSSIGEPEIYAVYICDNGNMIDTSSVSNFSIEGTITTGITVKAKIKANELAVYKKVHLWLKFPDSDNYGYFSIYQEAGSGSGSGSDTPVNPDTSLDGFISNITGGRISTVLTNVVSASDTPNTYSYLQSGFNAVSGESNATKSWMLANMLAELTPHVEGGYTSKTEHSGDTATNYFVNAAYAYGGLKLDYLSNEQIYMDRIKGASEYAKFKHANYASSNTAADAARTELRGKGISLAAMANDSDPNNTKSANPYFLKEEAVHVLPIIPNDMPTNSTSGGDWQFTLSMITQYPNATTEALLDKELDEAYICKILDADQSKYVTYTYTTNDIADAGGNQIKITFDRPRPGTQNNLNDQQGGTTFTVPSGGSVYVCNCSVEFSDHTDSDSEYNYDCSATNNGKTYCENDIDQFTNPSLGVGSNAYRSYSSGHSVRAFMDTLLLVEALGDSMSKDGYTSRIARAHLYCLNRVIVRAHWKTDTIAGRLAASMQIGFINGFNEFREEIAKVL